MKEDSYLLNQAPVVYLEKQELLYKKELTLILSIVITCLRVKRTWSSPSG